MSTGARSVCPDRYRASSGPPGSPKAMAATTDASTTTGIAVAPEDPRRFLWSPQRNSLGESREVIHGQGPSGVVEDGHQLALQRSMVSRGPFLETRGQRSR